MQGARPRRGDLAAGQILPSRQEAVPEASEWMVAIGGNASGWRCTACHPGACDGAEFGIHPSESFRLAGTMHAVVACLDGKYGLRRRLQHAMGGAAAVGTRIHRGTGRSEERRLGKECVSTCRYRGW